MTSTDIARQQPTGALATPESVPMARLDPYGPGGLAAQPGKMAPLAVVSLGYRQAPRQEGELGLPRASRREDQRWLHLHDPEGRAPGLAKALEAGDYRHLTIAFPMDDPQQFIQQSFMRWSASALEIYGDATGLTVIDTRNGAKHVRITPDQPDFERLVRTCKADTRIYFALAEWQPTEPGEAPESRVLFPDGFGFYCFRTTGRHTAAELIGYLESFRRFTRGRVAGIPFDLVVKFPEVVGPDGKKRTVPVANIVARPPEQTVLDSQTFRVLASAGLEQGRNLQLPALPSPEEIASEGPPPLEDDVPAEAIAQLAAGDFPCDYAAIVRTWHGIVRGTPLEHEDQRAEWLREWSEGAFDSLTAVRNLTQRQATQMLADLADGVSDVREELERVRQAELASKYDEIFGGDEPVPPSSPPQTAADVPTAADAQPAEETGPPTRSSAPAEPTSEDRSGRSERRAGDAALSPAPAAPESPMVTRVRHPLSQELATLIETAAEIGLDTERFRLGIPAPVTLFEARIAEIKDAILREEERRSQDESAQQAAF